jgi:ligand-binding sensor domain-containing protein/signal transduction histidine kinase
MVLVSRAVSALDADKPLTEYTHTVWTRKDGIPSAFINAIAQTSDGYLWLATSDGLVRFDGVRFVHWRPKTGHTALLGVVRSLCAARDGSLWIGTAAGLVGQLRGEDLTTVSVDAQAAALLEDRDGTLWVATPHDVLRFRASTRERIGGPMPLPGSWLSGPFQDRSGAIWLSTDHGILRVDPGHDARPLVQMSERTAWLSADASGAMWMTGPDGSNRRLADVATLHATAPARPSLNIQTVMRDSRGDVWIGTLGQGVRRIRTTTRGAENRERFSPSDGLSADSVWCLLEDREHNVWVGTQNGLNRFRDEKVTTLTSREGLASDDIDALAAGPDGSVWASSAIGLDRIDGEHRDSTRRGMRVSGVHVDRTNTLWAGTDRGVARLQQGRWQNLTATRLLTAVTAITGDEDNGIWLFDERKGLHRWKAGALTGFSSEPLLTGKTIRAAEADRGGRAWFGLHDGGVVRYEANRFHAYTEVDGLAGGSVNAIHIDDRAVVWVASEQGLSRLDGVRFVKWSRANGLPGERVLWILTESADRVALGYSTGVVRLARSELDRAAGDPSYRVTVQFLDESDGLKGSPDRRWQSAAVRASDRRLWFRTSEGVAIVDADHMSGNPVLPPVHIERLVADGIVVDAAQTVRLRPLTRDVEIDYTALSFAEPRNVRFRYKLEGFDSEWRDAGPRREAFYTNLRPRAYRFRVLASNNDGLWNESGAGVDFVVLPAFYQTQAFLLACAAALIIASWSAYRLRVWQVTNRLRDRFDERLKERTRIAQELHDSLIQDVMGISLQIEVSEALLPADVEARQPLSRALRLCRSALAEGRRALNELRSLPLTASDLVTSFSQLSGEGQGRSGTRVDVVVEGRERLLNALAGNDVLQVGRQAIANALQHAGATEIAVLVSYGVKDLRLRVLDDGCGISEEQLNRRGSGHYGIQGMQERAERIGATISIRSRVGGGTEINLCVPAHLVYEEGEARS